MGFLSWFFFLFRFLQKHNFPKLLVLTPKIYPFTIFKVKYSKNKEEGLFQPLSILVTCNLRKRELAMVTLSPKVNWRLSCMIFEGLRKSKLTGMKHAQKESAKKKPSSPISRNFFNYLQRFSTVLLYFIFLVSNISCYTLRQNRVFCHFNEKSIQNSRFFLMLIFFSDVNFFFNI